LLCFYLQLALPAMLPTRTTRPLVFFTSGKNVLVTSIKPHKLTSATLLYSASGTHSAGPIPKTPALFTSPHTPGMKAKLSISSICRKAWSEGIQYHDFSFNRRWGLTLQDDSLFSQLSKKNTQATLKIVWWEETCMRSACRATSSSLACVAGGIVCGRSFGDGRRLLAALHRSFKLPKWHVLKPSRWILDDRQ